MLDRRDILVDAIDKRVQQSFEHIDLVENGTAMQKVAYLHGVVTVYKLENKIIDTMLLVIIFVWRYENVGFLLLILSYGSLKFLAACRLLNK